MFVRLFLGSQIQFSSNYFEILVKMFDILLVRV